MTKYDNTNRGVLFVNQKKSDKSPDYSGTLNVAGVEMNLAGWKKQSKKGTTFLSLNLSAKQQGGYAPDVSDFDDDVPF